MIVRTRFAPSPTGYMHIGNLRTALFAYLTARRNNGVFILRIEDTDQERNIPEALAAIYASLALAGLDYDEGPGKDGGHGPYVQSERLDIYKAHAERLLASGGAFRCFCKKDDTGQEDAEPVRRDPCRFLTEHEIKTKINAGESFVIRQRIPESGSTTFVDEVYGEITIENSQLDDQVLLKSDGFPTYNFANVVDDHLMDITHVMRGQEYLSSTLSSMCRSQKRAVPLMNCHGPAAPAGEWLPTEYPVSTQTRADNSAGAPSLRRTFSRRPRRSASAGHLSGL